MPLEPNSAAESVPAAVPEPAAPTVTFGRKAGRVAMSIFCMALGVFLVIAPWSDLWPLGYLPALGPQWHAIWINSYFRGAASGLGVADIYIAIKEIFGFRDLTR
jgi:hypothetical protein